MSFLVTAATDFEMQAYLNAGGDTENTVRLITGVGLVETTLSLACLLQKQAGRFDGVLNFGIAGAYPENGIDLQAKMLDICLAEQEILGDFGICRDSEVASLNAKNLQIRDRFSLDRSLLLQAEKGLENSGIKGKQGIFITVNCVSGTLKRGRMLGRRFQGLCENMEGAAVARVCARFALPCCEVRCISNMVEERNTDNWQLQAACVRGGQAASAIIKSFVCTHPTGNIHD